MTRGSLQVQHRRDMRRSAALPGAGNPHMHAQTRTFACGHPHPHVPRPVTKFALVVQELLTSCALTMCCADQPRRLWLFGGAGGLWLQPQPQTQRRRAEPPGCGTPQQGSGAHEVLHSWAKWGLQCKGGLLLVLTPDA